MTLGNGPYVDRMPGLRGVAERKCIELEAEVERLREERRTWQNQRERMVNGYQRDHTELDRLRERCRNLDDEARDYAERMKRDRRRTADAIRALAACYDQQLLRSDHVVDDLLEDDGGWLRISRAHPGEPRLALTTEGRQRIVALLIESQEIGADDAG
jgi:hypothetical protein